MLKLVGVGHRKIRIACAATDTIDQNEMSHALRKLQRVKDRHGGALRKPQERQSFGTC